MHSLIHSTKLTKGPPSDSPEDMLRSFTRRKTTAANVGDGDRAQEVPAWTKRAIRGTEKSGQGLFWLGSKSQESQLEAQTREALSCKGSRCG